MWARRNPNATSVTHFQRRFSLNVWYGMLGKRLIGPFVLDNNLTGNTYKAFLRNDLPVLSEDFPLMLRSQMYFQHDGAPLYYTNRVRELINELFPNRWLGRGWPVEWPPRLPDLTALDYYLWGHRKTLVYETKVDSRAALRRRIFAAAEQIKKPSSQHCLCYWVPEDTRGKLHSNWRRPLRTSTLNQNDQLFNELLKNITLYSTTKKYSYERFFIVRGKIGVNFKVSCHWTDFRRYEVFIYHFSFSHFSSRYRKM